MCTILSNSHIFFHVYTLTFFRSFCFSLSHHISFLMPVKFVFVTLLPVRHHAQGGVRGHGEGPLTQVLPPPAPTQSAR